MTCCLPVIRDTKITEPVPICSQKFLKWYHVFNGITILGFLIITYATLYFLIGQRMLPGGDIFGFFLLVVFSYLLGWSLAYLPYLNLPPVFGMLLAGIIFKNADYYHLNQEIGHNTTAKIRVFCITFIAIRAGLSLTTSPLLKNPWIVISLAFVPCTAELIAMAICSKFILGYPWSWAFLNG